MIMEWTNSWGGIKFFIYLFNEKKNKIFIFIFFIFLFAIDIENQFLH